MKRNALGIEHLIGSLVLIFLVAFAQDLAEEAVKRIVEKASH